MAPVRDEPGRQVALLAAGGAVPQRIHGRGDLGGALERMRGDELAQQPLARGRRDTVERHLGLHVPLHVRGGGRVAESGEPVTGGATRAAGASITVMGGTVRPGTDTPAASARRAAKWISGASRRGEAGGCMSDVLYGNHVRNGTNVEGRPVDRQHRVAAGSRFQPEEQRGGQDRAGIRGCRRRTGKGGQTRNGTRCPVLVGGLPGELDRDELVGPVVARRCGEQDGHAAAHIGGIRVGHVRQRGVLDPNAVPVDAVLVESDQ